MAYYRENDDSDHAQYGKYSGSLRFPNGTDDRPEYSEQASYKKEGEIFVVTHEGRHEIQKQLNAEDEPVLTRLHQFEHETDLTLNNPLWQQVWTKCLMFFHYEILFLVIIFQS